MGEWLRSLWSDVRYGARMLFRNPGFSIAAVIILALGIGGNTAIFTIMSAVLLKPLPYDQPQRLVALDARQKDKQSRCCTLNWTDLVRERNHSFAGVAVAANDSLSLTGRGEPEEAPIARVSPNFFNVLGVKPQLGSVFADQDGRPEGRRVVMLSDAFWHTRFGSDRSIVGQTIDLDSTPYTVIGVLPAGVPFPFLGPADIWTPRYFEHSLFTTQRLRMGVGYLSAYARLRAGVSQESALAELRVLHDQYRKENPGFPDTDPGISASVNNLQETVVANQRTELIFLMVAVCLVLLVGSANIASLLLSRALARRKEVAVRTALGAKRSLIIKQLLTESVLLAIIAGAIGLSVSLVFARLLITMGQFNLPQGTSIHMDAWVFLFAAGVSLLTGLFFGIFPALQLSRTNINDSLRDEGRGSTSGHARVQVKNVLVMGQVAVSMVLLIFAGLLMRNFAHLMSTDPGFDVTNVISMHISLPTVRYAETQKQISFFDEVQRRVSTLPGVRSVAISASLPLSPIRITPMLPEGQPAVPLGERPFIIIEQISPKFFETMRIPIRNGRTFNDADNAQAPKVTIVNETFARQFWPNQNPVGKHIVIGRGPDASEVVGVAMDVKNKGMAQDTAPQIYVPFAQISWRYMNLLVRTSTDPHSLFSAIRAQIWAVDPDQPITNQQLAEDLVSGSRVESRSRAFLLGIFSAMGLVLAVLGIYSILAYSVAQRRQELGIRLALGAEKSDIVRLVVRQGMTLILIGIAAGLVAALICTRFISSFLYQIKTLDAVTFVIAPVVFLMTGAVASFFPAYRATKVDPTEAIRGSN